MDAVTWRDNPILMRHVRSRLRRHELWPSCLVVVCLCAFITYLMASEVGHSQKDSQAALLWLVIVQCVILFVMGSAQVFASVFRAKESSVLDFHRISPLSSLTLVTGFLFGGPIREYVLFAATLPFTLYAVAVGTVPLLAWVLGLAAMLMAALWYHLAALVAGLVAERGKAGYGIVGVGVLALHALVAVPPFGYLTIVPMCELVYNWSSSLAALPALSKEATAVSLSMLHQGLLIIFLLLGATRKMRHEEMPLWSKPATAVFFFLVACLAHLDLSPANRPDNGELSVFGTYGLWAAALWLTLMATPSLRDYGRGIRRALRLGLKGAPAWTDAATNHAPLVILAVLLGLSIASLPVGGENSHQVLPMQSALPAMLSLLVFGGALQAFTLEYRKKSRAYFLFLVFVLWIVPLLAAVMVGLVPNLKDAATSIFCISPLAGLGLSADASTSSVLTMAGTAINGVLALYFGLRSWRAERACVQAAT